MRPRDAWISCRLASHLVEARLQGGIELRIVQHRAQLARDLDDRALLLRCEDTILDRALDDDDALQLSRVGHRRQTDVRTLTPLQHLRHPDLEPAVGGESCLHDAGGLDLTQRHRRTVDLGIADPGAQRVLGQQPGLRGAQSERRPKPLGGLQHQFVQRHRPGHARRERAGEVGRRGGVASRGSVDRRADPIGEHDDQRDRDCHRQERRANEAALRPIRYTSEYEDHGAEREPHSDGDDDEPEREPHDPPSEHARHRHSAFRTAAGFTRRATSPGPSETSRAAISVIGITRIEYGDSTGSFTTPSR